MTTTTVRKTPSHFIIDVDGVLTTGQFLYSSRGKEYKVFGPHDNDGLKLLDGRIHILFVTADARGLPISRKRIVTDMGRRLLLVREDERIHLLARKYGLENVVYMGDGLFDAPILEQCAYGIAPKNARAEARKAADYVTPSRGGEGAVLDASLHILRKFFSQRRSRRVNV